MKPRWVVFAVIILCLGMLQVAQAQSGDQEVTIFVRCQGPNDIAGDADFGLIWDDGTNTGVISLKATCYGRENPENNCGEKGCRAVTMSAPIPPGSRITSWKGRTNAWRPDPEKQCIGEIFYGSSLPVKIHSGQCAPYSVTVEIE